MTDEREQQPRTGDVVHQPVMLTEVLDWLSPRPGGRYLDGTVGLGGHSAGIMERTAGEALVLGLDRDAQALERARERLAVYGDRVSLRLSRFSAFAEALAAQGWDTVDGAVLDLGVSSLQLDVAERGFSFLHDGPLDMRMAGSSPELTAAALVNRAGVAELKRIIYAYGEEPMAGRIARRIVEARESGPIETTLQLAWIVERAYPAAWRAKARNHPATRTFQALRIAVNRELDELEAFLANIPAVLAPGARVAIISFHSLEDRLVKNAFRQAARPCVCPPEQLVCTCARQPLLHVLTKKPIAPSDTESATNSRARSAKLRVAERSVEGAVPINKGWKRRLRAELQAREGRV